MADTKTTTGAAAEGAVQEAAEKKLSPKNKISRGIDPNMKTTYVDLNQTKEQNETIAKAAKFRKCKVTDVLRPILEKALAEHWSHIEADAAKYVPTAPVAKIGKKLDEMSTEDIEKYVAKQDNIAKNAAERAKQAGDKARELLAKARQRTAQA